MKQAMGFRQFLFRGREKVDGGWELLALAYTLCRQLDSLHTG